MKNQFLFNKYLSMLGFLAVILLSCTANIDTSPPILSNPKPSGILSTGTKELLISMKTNEKASCKFEQNKDVNFEQMTKSLSSNDGKSHEQTITSLLDGKKYAYFVHCKDSTGNTSQNSLKISFEIAKDDSDATPPIRMNAKPSGILTADTTITTISLETDEKAVCKYDLSSNIYEDMVFTFAKTDGLEHSQAIDSLSNGASYNYFVRCKDEADNKNDDDLNITFSIAKISDPSIKKLPIGMNLDANNYYSLSIPFNDVMKTASEMFSYEIDNWDSWNSQKISKIAVDSSAWPLELPYSENSKEHGVRFLINNFYSGDYVLLYDGEGEIRVDGVEVNTISGITHIQLTGKGGNVWLDISSSSASNHIHNMRIIPSGFANNEASMPTFRQDYLEGLKPFHALRFMDFSEINNSKQSEWSDRNKKDHFTQGNGKGVAWEYIIELVNELKTDVWICVPHQASDDYIKQLALLLKNNLNPNSKIYIESSNEVWNWMFEQAHYILDNAPDHPNSYVSSALAAIGPVGENHPEKDAYMMARVFKIFTQVWGSQKGRLTRVAAVQHGWVDNTRRILEYLFNTDGIGADAVSPAGYFNYNNDDHATWNAMNSANVTAKMILDSAFNVLDNPSIEDEADWTRETAKYAKQFGLDFVIYEGGQHMQPFEQGDWAYNHAVYDAQIDSRMYELYMKNFSIHTEEDVDTKLFMAYAYISDRKSQFGSWGHLESLSQLGQASSLKQIAPKYQALLDINTH